MSQDDDKLIQGHDYDGIQELDNPLPGWWLVTFFGTIIFSFIYFLHYEIAGGPDQKAELEASLSALSSLRQGGPVMDAQKLEALLSTSSLDAGQTAYAAKCAVCHGPNGEGLIGPNLTDLHFIHENGSAISIYQIIADGVPAKGMPAWKDLVSSDELVDITHFVYQLKGTFAPGGRPPQGDEHP